MCTLLSNSTSLSIPQIKKKEKGMESKNEYRKGLWTEEEDKILMDYIKVHGKGHWNRIANKTDLKRSGKSCRLRWINYLSPSVKRGSFTEEEEDLIIRLHNLLGNRWSLIAGRVPGRTDNQVKNYWNSHLSKKLGFQKKKSTINVGVSSSTNSSRAVNASTSSSSNNFCCSTSNGKVDVETNITSQKAIVAKAPQVQEVVLNECYPPNLDQFWDFFSEELFDLSTSNLMEFFR